MQTKLLEIRDAATFIPAMGIFMSARDAADESEEYLLRRSGWGYNGPAVFLCKLETGGGEYDPFKWPFSGGRTMNAAHQWIEANWDKLKSGDVVDVEFILGITKQPKQSERITHPV